MNIQIHSVFFILLLIFFVIEASKFIFKDKYAKKEGYLMIFNKYSKLEIIGAFVLILTLNIGCNDFYSYLKETIIFDFSLLSEKDLELHTGKVFFILEKFFVILFLVGLIFDFRSLFFKKKRVSLRVLASFFSFFYDFLFITLVALPFSGIYWGELLESSRIGTSIFLFICYFGIYIIYIFYKVSILISNYFENRIPGVKEIKEKIKDLKEELAEKKSEQELLEKMYAIFQRNNCFVKFPEEVVAARLSFRKNKMIEVWEKEAEIKDLEFKVAALTKKSRGLQT